ncbi:MAG TPA: hypothetical protein VFE75_07725 [Rhodanobacter sp.]|jgi:hypothetical protein|nr:hypothetical protein [Rhodanobacter sp.]
MNMMLCEAKCGKKQNFEAERAPRRGVEHGVAAGMADPRRVSPVPVLELHAIADLAPPRISFAGGAWRA